MIVAVEKKQQSHHFLSISSIASLLLSTFLLVIIYHMATDGTAGDFVVSTSLAEIAKNFLIGFAVNFILALIGVSLLEGKNARALKNYLIMGFQLGCVPPILLYIEANFFQVTGMVTQIFDMFLFLCSFPVFIVSGIFSATIYWCFSFAESAARPLLYIGIASVMAYFTYYAAYILLLTV